MNDLDLEDLESRLYSQVYHGLHDESDENNFYVSQPVTDMRRPCRYFGPWSPASKHQNKNTSHKQANSRTPIHREIEKSESNFLNYEKPNSPHCNSRNLIVVSPNQAITSMTPKEVKKAKWREKLKEKKKQKQAMKMQRKLLKAEKIQESEQPEVIALSDSDEDDSCVLIANNWPLLSVVDSDDEKNDPKSNFVLKTEKAPSVLNESLSDDVILVEPVSIPPEVINLDEDTETSPRKSKNIETASSSSSENLSVPPSPKKSVKQIQKERRELLSTPDSASNDFISNSGVELKKTNFNFSLHGSDFKDGDFRKPAARNETCETESSSSTTDVNSVTLMQNTVFNEVDFPKDDIFSESNLESFGNFITPLRKSLGTAEVQSSPLRVTENHTQNAYTSDSSSESELEETQLTQKQKKLPELSPMTTIVNKVQSILCSKYDLLNSVQLDSPVNETKQKKQKGKKGKKKKNSVSASSIDNSEENSNNSNVIIEAEDAGKGKKRRSSRLEGAESSENQKKKMMNEESVEQEFSVENKPPGIEASVVIKTEKEDEIPENPKLDISAAVKTEGKGESHNERAEKDKSEACFQKERTASPQPQSVDNPLEDLVVVDETFAHETDTDSVLSALHDQEDITLNCEATSDSPTKSLDFDPEYFNVRDMQLTMSNDPKLWDILDCDRTPTYRIKGRRCNKCKQFGHMAIRCPNKVEAKCSLCGRSGHYEPRCPNKICTQCGHRSPYSTNYCNHCFKYRTYQCQICSMTGHPPSACPDLWRRYYLTTKEGPLITFDSCSALKEKQTNKLWCSGCAQSGHLEHSCRFYKSIYPAADPFIKSYEDIYRNKTQTSYEQRQQTSDANYDNYHYHASQQGFDQRNVVGGRFNQNNSYGQMNRQYISPFMDGLFVANQQNFFSPLPNNVVQIPQSNYYGNANQEMFDQPLPNYISFEEPSSSFEEVPNDDVSNNLKSTRRMRRSNAMFFSSTANQLHHFITEELNKLSKMALMSNKMVKEFRKRQAPRRDSIEKEDYFEKLNMVLFGIYNLLDGKTHLNRLKRFGRKRLKAKVDNRTRRILHESYCYIFGRDKHYGVDYSDLLRRV